MFRLRRRLRFQQCFWRVKPATIRLRIIRSFLKFYTSSNPDLVGFIGLSKKSTCGQVYISFLLRHFKVKKTQPRPQGAFPTSTAREKRPGDEADLVAKGRTTTYA